LDTLGRGDVEVASTLCIEKTAEYGGGIEVGPVYVLVVWFYETGWSGTWGVMELRGGWIDMPLDGKYENMSILPAHKVQTPVDAHQSTCSHITDEAIIFDWEIAYREKQKSVTYSPEVGEADHLSPFSSRPQTARMGT
jgi:hypothetical protein